MQIQPNTDHTITGTQRLTARVEAQVQDALGRYADRVTRVEDASERFSAAAGEGRTTARLEDIARAAVEGHIDTLLLEASRIELGRIDALGVVQPGELDDPDTGAAAILR